MQTMSAPAQDGWQPGRVPRLNYRNSRPSEEPSSSRQNSIVQSTTETIGESKPNGPTIRQIRESMVLNASPQPQPAASFRAPMPPKKKGSLFGSLFAVKEPTQAALNQVAAQMIAQHGTTSPQKVPNVRMEKMPDHVPKVNSKWDGIPDAVKQREKEEKEKQRAAKRHSWNAATFRSHSVESDEGRGRNRDSILSRGTEASDSSRARSAHSRGSGRRVPNPHRFYAQSVNSSGDLASQQRSEDQQTGEDKRTNSSHSQSLRSPSGTSLPEIMAFFPNGIPATPSVPEKYRQEAALKERPNAGDKNTNPKSSHPIQIPSIEAIPEHTSSPVATPRERSPVTPSAQQMQELSVPRQNDLDVILESSVPKVPNLPIHYHQVTHRPAVPFLAGEARELELPDEDAEQQQATTQQPPIMSSPAPPSIPPRSADRQTLDLEKRPDSSRARLGLRASMVVRNETAPWEGVDPPTEPSLTSRSSSSWSSMPASPKYFSTFGSIRKKNS